MKPLKRLETIGKALEKEFDGQVEGLALYGSPLTSEVKLVVNEQRIRVCFVLNPYEAPGDVIEIAIDRVRRKLNK